jgi:hypothetical protein
MKRFAAIVTLVAAGLVVVPAVMRADAKTVEKSTVKFEGLLGTLIHSAGGKDGLTMTRSVKGQRMASLNDQGGEIVDLSEEKVYHLDAHKKEYTVVTFAQLRQQLADMQAKMAGARQPDQKDDLQGKQIEFDIDVHDSGQHKTVAGVDTHEVIVTITMRQNGMRLEEGGGAVMTNNIWIGPHAAALDELREFQMKFLKAAYGDAFGSGDMQQMAGLAAMYPSFSQVSVKMSGELGKLDGTPFMTITKFETVKSPDAMKASQPGGGAGGGGLTGGIMSRMMQRGPAQARSTVMTSTTEMVSIGTTVSADDVALPAGFKEKK